MTDQESSRAALRRRDARVWRMGAALVVCVVTFDLLSVFAPAFMGDPLWSGGVASRGIFFAALIVFAVIGVAWVFVRRLNREDAAGATGGAAPRPDP